MSSWFDDYRVLECGEPFGLRLRRTIGYLVRRDGMMGLSRPRKYAPAHESILFRLVDSYVRGERDDGKTESEILEERIPPIHDGLEEKE